MTGYTRLLFALALPVLMSACASTTVKKNPGLHDRGIRYYRPKPYLFLEPAMGKSDELVTISLQYLPDFSEEYSIHIRAGIGTNKTSLKLEDGWNLTEINVDVDSKVSENVEAVAKLIEAVPKLRPTSPNQPVGAVKATNVPFGYYEAVINRGPDGKKQLYGWRYIGFSPYVSCPQNTSGVECADCHNQIVYGLVFEKGVMRFKPLNEAIVPNIARTGPGEGVSQDPTQVPEEVKNAVASYFSSDKVLSAPVDASQFTFGVDITKKLYTVKPNFFDSNPAIRASQVQALVGKMMAKDIKDLEEKLSATLTDILKSQPGFLNAGFGIQITVTQ